MSDTQDIAFSDAHKLDKKIPQELLMKYQGKWYILKAGLEWKANHLFGGGNYGVTTDLITTSNDAVLAKATFKTKGGVEFSNYGEASKANVSNPAMHKYLLHLAITRAECRVLRMATACGYTSVEEMDMDNGVKELPATAHDSDPATEAQKATLVKLGGVIDPKDMTQGQAKAAIDKQLKGKK